MIHQRLTIFYENALIIHLSNTWNEISYKYKDVTCLPNPSLQSNFRNYLFNALHIITSLSYFVALSTEITYASPVAGLGICQRTPSPRCSKKAVSVSTGSRGKSREWKSAGPTTNTHSLSVIVRLGILIAFRPGRTPIQSCVHSVLLQD